MFEKVHAHFFSEASREKSNMYFEHCVERERKVQNAIISCMESDHYIEVPLHSIPVLRKF